MSKKRSIQAFILKLAFSISIVVYLLLAKTSLHDIFQTIKSVVVIWLVVAFMIGAVFGLLISAIRWKILIQAQGDSVPLGFLYMSYWVGIFFNNFLPTRVGGDVVRMWDGSRYSKSFTKSSAIVVVERLSGIIVLFFFALIAALFRLDMAKDFPMVWIALAIGFIGLAILFLFLLPFTRRLLEKMPQKKMLIRTTEKILLFRETILFYKNKKKALLQALLCAFLLQVNVIIFYYLIGKALALEIPFLDYFIFIPVVHLILLVPITINGFGLRELSYSEIFRFYGFLPQTAIAFAWIDVGLFLIGGIIGAVIYIIRK